MGWTSENQVYLPDYNVARGGVYELKLKPPFDFNGSSLRIFPLRARQNRLQAFIDSYLNFGSQDGTPAGYFRAYLPYVYLTIINYGKMSLDAANLGWVSQNEVFMNIPLLRYKWIRKKLVFQDFASASPFIYVDNDLSLVTGRDVYGWQKELVSADQMSSTWATRQDEARIAVRFSSPCPPGRLAGAREDSLPLLQIEYTLGDPLSRFPPNPRADWLPWNILANIFTSSGELMSDYVEILRGLRVAQRLPLARGVPKALEQLLRIGLNKDPIVWNTLNVKQFRDAEHPRLACDQEITCAPIELQRFGGIELIGEGPLLAGDSSGGLTIDLFDYADSPIASILGLEAATTTKMGDATIHRIRPVFPMRFDADLRYRPGYAIAWRTKNSGWHDESNRHVGRTEPADYNTALGEAADEAVGPFVFPNATLRVLPLLADKEKLDAFLQDYLGKPLRAGAATTDDGKPVTISLWGNLVYLVATTFEGVASETNDVGRWTERDLVFYVPARVMAGQELWKIVLVPVYAFADDTRAVLTGTEVNGIPFAKATLESPSAAWLDDDGPAEATKRGLLRATTLILPALGAGLEATERVFLEVDEGAPFAKHSGNRWRGVAEGWAISLKQNLEEQLARVNDKDLFTEGRALAFQVLALSRPVHIWTLKQFPDVHDASKACYQAIVEVDRKITRVHGIQEIESSLYLRMRSYASLRIVEKLGLLTIAAEDKDGVPEHLLQAVRPFWTKVSMREELGKNILVRDRSHPDRWEPSHLNEPVPMALGEDDIRAVTLLAQAAEPRRLRELYFERPSIPYPCCPEAPRPVEENVVDRVTAKLFPQDILNSVLSEEWARFDGCLWTDARRKLRHQFRSEVEKNAGKSLWEQAEDELTWWVNTLVTGPNDRNELWNVACLLLVDRFSARFAAASPPGSETSRTEEQYRCFFVGKFAEVMSRLSAAGDKKWSAPPPNIVDEHIKKLMDRRKSAVAAVTPSAGFDEACSIADVTRERLLVVLAKLHQKPYHLIVPWDILWNRKERRHMFPHSTPTGKEPYLGRGASDHFAEEPKNPAPGNKRMV
ncbi:MAG: hypothetical protein ABJE95_07780 [Byssovorax sp.]